MKWLITMLLILLFYVNTQAQSVPQYFPTNGLVAAYLFSGNAKDSSGNGNDGIVTGATLTTDRFGRANSAYYFNGTSNYITISSSGSLDITNSSFSMSAWIKSYDYNPATYGKEIFWRGDIISAHDPYALYISSGQLYFRRDVASGTTTNQVGFPTSIVDTNYWHLVVGVWDSVAQTMSLYYDGWLIKHQVLPGTMSYSTSGFVNMIGAHNDFSIPPYFYGKIDEVGLWNRALDSCEIKRLFYSSKTLITGNPTNQISTVGGIANFSIVDVDTAISYQWQVNAGSGFTNVPSSLPYIGTTSPILTINPTSKSMDGYLYRCVRIGKACNDTSSTALLAVHSVSVNNLSLNQNNIIVYPNPAFDQITITMPFYSGENIIAELYDVVGKKLFENKIMGTTTTMNINNFMPGIYTLKIVLDGNSFFKKIVK